MSDGKESQEQIGDKIAVILAFESADKVLRAAVSAEKERYSDLGYSVNMCSVEFGRDRTGKAVLVSKGKGASSPSSLIDSLKKASDGVLLISHHGARDGSSDFPGKITANALSNTGLVGNLKGAHVRYLPCYATKGKEANDFFKTLARQGACNFMGDAVNLGRLTIIDSFDPPNTILKEKTANIYVKRGYSFVQVKNKATQEVQYREPSHMMDSKGRFKHTSYFLVSSSGILKQTNNPEDVREFGEKLGKIDSGISVLNSGGTTTNVFDLSKSSSQRSSKRPVKSATKKSVKNRIVQKLNAKKDTVKKIST